MALTRKKKEQLTSLYGEELATAPHAYLLKYEGITVPQDTELRAKIRETGSGYAVVKNRLALRVIEGKPLGDLAEHFTGPTAVAYSQDDPVGLAKALTDFSKTVPALEFKAGLLDGAAVGGEDIKAIANLPSREELITKLVFLLQSPISRFVRGMGAIPTQFVQVLEQVRQKKESEG